MAISVNGLRAQSFASAVIEWDPRQQSIEMAGVSVGTFDRTRLGD
jgi:hypothetical protein